MFIVHEGSNNADVFCDFVILNLACGFLQPWDFLVLENALIHHFQESTGLDAHLWSWHGIFLQFLPTRLQELNPIKLLWNVLMQRLRHYPLIGPEDYRLRTHGNPRAAERIINKFTHNDVDESFRHCGYIWGECKYSMILMIRRDCIYSFSSHGYLSQLYA